MKEREVQYVQNFFFIFFCDFEFNVGLDFCLLQTQMHPPQAKGCGGSSISVWNFVSYNSTAFSFPSRHNTLGSTNVVPSPLQAMVIATGVCGGEIHHKRTPEPLKKCTPSPLHCRRHKSLHGARPHIRCAPFLCAHENSFHPGEANGHLFRRTTFVYFYNTVRKNKGE